MQFSKVNVIQKEQFMINSKTKGKKLIDRLFDYVLYKNPTYTFYFGVPSYTYMRAKAFCEDIAEKIEGEFIISDLSKALYLDFLDYLKNTNNGDAIFKRLQARDLSPVMIRKDNDDEWLFEDQRGFKVVATKLGHKDALRGEFILRDMLDIYKDHTFTLENVLEIIFRDFIDDYRRGFIKDPLSKINKYI